MDLARITDEILSRSGDARRFMVAIAGPPGSGKSTLGASLTEALAARGRETALVPMDGFHFDDAVLRERGLAERKGAPETFDFAGFYTLLGRIRAGEPEVAIPLFDRTMELSRAAAAIVPANTRLVLVEGNYLLLDEGPWNALAEIFDFSIYVDVPQAELERRLLARWMHHGHDVVAARHRVKMNDLPNAERVAKRRRIADMVV